MKINLRTIAITLALAAGLAACGGSEDPPSVTQATYSQTAPAGSMTLGVGQKADERAVLTVSHAVGPKLTRVQVTVGASNVRAAGTLAGGGLRWMIKADGRVIASGPLTAPPGAVGISGVSSTEMTVSAGDFIEVQVVAAIASDGAAAVALQWDAVSADLTVKELAP